MCVCSVLSNSATRWTVEHQAPLSMGFSRQEYWSGSPFPTPGDLPDPGIKCTFLSLLPNPGMEPASLVSRALAGRFFSTSATSEASKSTTPQLKKGEKRTLSNTLPMLHKNISNKPTCRLSDALQRGSLSVAPGSASEPVRNADYWAPPGTD